MPLYNTHPNNPSQIYFHSIFFSEKKHPKDHRQSLTKMPPATNPSSSSSSSSSSRWCPTPEQLMILEEMYRTGTRTPNAAQIQQITAHLSFYGKIEGKNVFYWFQNHKARDRQKLRRKLYKQLQQQQAVLFHHHHFNNNHHLMMFNNHIAHQNHHFLSHNVPTSINETPFAFLNHDQQQQQQPLSGSMPSQVEGVFEDHNHAPSGTHNHNHNQMMSHAWKMEIPSAGGDTDQSQLDQKENSNMMMMKSTYDRDWKMMFDVGPLANSNNNTNNSPSRPCNSNNKPLKTLQLFPITATSLKEDCTTSSKRALDHDLSA